jgi:hypothetical protein
MSLHFLGDDSIRHYALVYICRIFLQAVELKMAVLMQINGLPSWHSICINILPIVLPLFNLLGVVV